MEVNNGIILQFGFSQVTGVQTIYFPVAYKNKILNFVWGAFGSDVRNFTDQPNPHILTNSSITIYSVSYFSSVNGNLRAGIYYITLGY